MSAEREARLRLLLRKAERSRELEPFIQRLMDATHLPHDSFPFLSLEETDSYKQMLNTRYVQDLRTADKLMLVWDEPDEMRDVLSGMAAAALELDLAWWEVQLVVHADDLRQGHLVEGHRGLNGLAAQVHEGLRLEQHHLAGPDLGLGGLGAELVAEGRSRPARGQPVHHHEAHVVPVSAVFWPGVPESDD